jgi:hypothetical protein
MDFADKLRRVLERLIPARRPQGGYCIVCQREFRGTGACPNRLRHGNAKMPLPPDIQRR